MSIRKHSLVITLSLVILTLISACGGRATPDAGATLAPMYTAAAQTLQALSTQVALTPDVPAQITPMPTSTPIVPLPTIAPPALPTPVPQIPPPVTRCDWVGFVADVSVPDGTSFAPSTAFTKTWRLKNIGTCTWTTAYALVFSSGSAMGGPAVINLLGSVAPGQMVDIPVNLTAPATAGNYR
ncbi:MAG: hypothetical protein C0393_01940, partial [Anaerolinea sp.]|nr:hypothetical protein [Anaerolinea sp.]